MQLTISEQIKVLQKRRGISSTEMAKLLGVTYQNYLRRLRLNSFTSAEIEKIAEFLNSTVVFQLND